MRQDFEKRFKIPLSDNEARARFVNRVHTAVFENFQHTDSTTYEIRQSIATVLGERFSYTWDLRGYSREFNLTLRLIEGVIEACLKDPSWAQDGAKAALQVKEFVETAESDLGVSFDGRQFLPTGAELLDAKLVNDPLDWCRREGLERVVRPLEKSLRDLLDGRNKPDRRIDAVTAAYEAVEAMAKQVTGIDKPLSGLREAFSAKMGVSKSADKMLAEFVDWACTYRHSEKSDRPKPAVLSYPEAEALVYQAGIIIRLAITSSEPRASVA